MTKIWALSDTHLSADGTKPMDIFGDIWENHVERIITNWNRVVGDDDVVMVGGDVAWGNHFDRVLPDLELLDGLKGRIKILIKGNHDFWWKKAHKFEDRLPKSLRLLEGGSIQVGDQIVCGTRGWFAPNDPYFTEKDQKTFDKEMRLLKTALESALKHNLPGGIHLITHFPPFTHHGEKTAFFELAAQYPVATYSFGHFHKKAEWAATPQGSVNGIRLFQTASDFLGHTPALIFED